MIDGEVAQVMTALRPVGAALVVAVLFVTAGCVGFALGEEPLSYEANNATVPDDQRGGYELVREEVVVQNQTINESGVNRTVTVSNYAGVYTKNESINADSQQLASLAVISTPIVDVFERPVNPVGNMSEQELLEFLTEQIEDSEYGDVETFERVPDEQVGPETDDVTVLGRQTDVAVFQSTQEVQGRTVELRVYVTRVRHGDDYVVMLGGHSMLHPAEGYAIVDLMRSVEHDED